MDKNFFFILILGLILSPVSFAEKPGFTVGVGVAVPDFQNAIGPEGAATPSAQMVGDRTLTPIALIVTDPTPIVNSDGFRWLRWSVELGLHPLQVTKQVENRITDAAGENMHNLGTEVDMGTSLKGYIGYINPTLSIYHQFTDKIYAFLGFGAGVGYASVKGDYFVTAGADASTSCLNSTTLATVQANCERRDVSIDKFAIGSNAMFGISMGPVGIRYSRGGPTFSDGRYQHKTVGSLGMLLLQFHF